MSQDYPILHWPYSEIVLSSHEDARLDSSRHWNWKQILRMREEEFCTRQILLCGILGRQTEHVVHRHARLTRRE